MLTEIKVFQQPEHRHRNDIEFDVYALHKNKNETRQWEVDNKFTSWRAFASVATYPESIYHYAFGFGNEDPMSIEETTQVAGILNHERVYDKTVRTKMFMGLLPKPFHEQRVALAKKRAKRRVLSLLGEFVIQGESSTTFSG